VQLVIFSSTFNVSYIIRKYSMWQLLYHFLRFWSGTKQRLTCDRWKAGAFMFHVHRWSVRVCMRFNHACHRNLLCSKPLTLPSIVYVNTWEELVQVSVKCWRGPEIDLVDPSSHLIHNPSSGWRAYLMHVPFSAMVAAREQVQYILLIYIVSHNSWLSSNNNTCSHPSHMYV